MSWLADKPRWIRADPRGLLIDYRQARENEIGPSLVLLGSTLLAAATAWSLDGSSFTIGIASASTYLLVAAVISQVWTARSKMVLNDHEIRWAMVRAGRVLEQRSTDLASVRDVSLFGNAADGWGIRLRLVGNVYWDLDIPPSTRREAAWLADWIREQAQVAEPVPEPTAEDLARREQVERLIER